MNPKVEAPTEEPDGYVACDFIRACWTARKACNDNPEEQMFQDAKSATQWLHENGCKSVRVYGY